MNKIQTIALVANDAGGARAVLPVARELLRRGHRVVAIVAGPAVHIFGDGPGKVLEVPDDTPVEVLAISLRAEKVDVLLSASGLYNQVEHTTRRAARAVGVPIVALLDSWFNYRERFERGTETSHPDKICVIDDLTRDGMIGAGFDQSMVFLTGHPDLELSARQSARDARASTGDLAITFFSDPFYMGPGYQYYSGPGAIMNPDGSPTFGYTTREILPAVLDALEAALEAENTAADMAVRPHPYEDSELVREVLKEAHPRRVHTRLVTAGTAMDCIEASDVVVGMMTIALLHAAMRGKPALSVEIGLRESGQEDPCVSNQLGYTHGIFDRAALDAACRLVARRDWSALMPRPRSFLPLEGAAARVADLVTC